MNVERVAFAGDWHANIGWALDYVGDAARAGAQAILHTGDFGYDFEPRFLDILNALLDVRGMDLWFVCGNHENFERLARFPVGADGTRMLRPRIRHLPRGFAWTWSGVRFLAVGGAVSVDMKRREPYVSWWPGEALSIAEVRRCREQGPADVVVAHDCPAGVPLALAKPRPWWGEEVVAASEHNRAALLHAIELARPRLLVHGHYHLWHDTTVDLGWGPVRVVGLDRDGSPADRNLLVADVADLVPALPQ